MLDGRLALWSPECAELIRNEYDRMARLSAGAANIGPEQANSRRELLGALPGPRQPPNKRLPPFSSIAEAANLALMGIRQLVIEDRTR